MTTTDAAAAQRHSLAVALAVIMGLASLSLAGCGGGGGTSLTSLFSSANSASQEPTATPAAAQAPRAKVAINAIVGPPDALGRQLHQEFTSALERQRVGVTQAKGERVDFNLRPYILAAKERNGTKVSYVLDVTAPSGKRVNRFAGEEVVAASPSRDPWAAITPAVAEAIAAKATGAFVAWLPNAPTSGVAVASAAPTSANSASTARTSAGSETRTAARPASRKTAAAASAQTTGSIGRDGLAAVVPTVTGAPGDGSTSLTAAIQRELRSKGIALADRATPATYQVQGAVILGSARDGKQPIQIEWVVRDPRGKKLGTVSQKNDIPAGSLDGPWGKVADQAAGAAVQGILKLLPGGGRTASVN